MFYLSFLLISTLLSRDTTNPYRNVFAHFGFRKDVKWNNEIIENILFFIPYSLFFLAAFRPEKPWRDTLILSASTTCVIEFSQLLFWLGDFQLSDIFHNILGGMIGCLLWCLVLQIRYARARGSVAEGRNGDVP